MQVTFELNYYIFIAIALLGVVVYFVYKELTYHEEYYKKIIDTSSNIVMIRKNEKIIEVNKPFFKYFREFANIEEFSKKHACIYDFFEDEEGYLGATLDGESWVRHLVLHQDLKHKVKMTIENKRYYFLISASKIDAKRDVYAVIFSDISEQEQSQNALKLLSINDALTNVGNRRYFDQKLHEHLTLTQRYKHPFSYMIFDIDFFKKINDIYGHDVGDKVLISFANLIKSNLREGDIFARVGGEEFGLLLPSTTSDKAYTLAQKLRVLVEEYNGVTPITTSIGIVQYEKGDDDKSILKRADFALYKAKDGGRNKVVLG